MLYKSINLLSWSSSNYNESYLHMCYKNKSYTNLIYTSSDCYCSPLSSLERIWKLGRGTQSPVQFGTTIKKRFAPKDASQVRYTYLFPSTLPRRRTSTMSRIWLGMLGEASTELLCPQPWGGGCPPALTWGQSFWQLRPSRAPAAAAALQKPNPHPFPLCQAFQQIIDEEKSRREKDVIRFLQLNICFSCHPYL